ncbi:MAG: PfkB family carbohydrate kinase [Alphaproteobacteria bacterium]|jgi:rfaE bifunctional protein nucleotidyltransferase chain/domain|nr:PfkB family carbohydrate kinase [Alphaproteobacteria bacterium]
MTASFSKQNRGPNFGSAPLVANARDKIKSIDELASLANSFQAQGRNVVLAHGVFDLVHLGHVRHLEAAAREGDLLFVTVTADEFVNKGPGRPVFPQQLRAEMLAALECVDWVGVSRWSSAEEVISRLKPDTYVKGSDYQNEEEDLTGRIVSERETVERHGGRIVFTDDLTFSSSNLLNEHFSFLSPDVQNFLTGLRRRNALPRILGELDAIRDMRVLIIGDAIIDEYQYAVPMGKSAKENIIAANHVANFCAEVEIMTCLGSQESYEDLIRDSVHDNVSVNFLTRPGVPTTRKCRFVDPGHMRKLFEVYFFDDTPINGTLEGELCDFIAARAGDFDAVIVTDFGHGMMTRRAIDSVVEHAPFLAVNAQSNSANHGFNLITRYRQADYVCIDEPEARLATGDRFNELGTLISDDLSGHIDCRRFAVTHGEKGCVTYQPGDGLHTVPAFTQQVVDTVGAGDAFLAVTAPLAARGVDMETLGIVGNAVGAMKVGIVGHRQSIEKAPPMKYITALLK